MLLYLILLDDVPDHIQVYSSFMVSANVVCSFALMMLFEIRLEINVEVTFIVADKKAAPPTPHGHHHHRPGPLAIAALIFFVLCVEIVVCRGVYKYHKYRTKSRQK